MAEQWSEATTEAIETSLKQRSYHEMIETRCETMFSTSTESRAAVANGVASEVKDLLAKLEKLGLAEVRIEDVKRFKQSESRSDESAN
eukprot:12047844-Karenia_brevis.AAC.1